MQIGYFTKKNTTIKKYGNLLYFKKRDYTKPEGVSRSSC